MSAHISLCAIRAALLTRRDLHRQRRIAAMTNDEFLVWWETPAITES